MSKFSPFLVKSLAALDKASFDELMAEVKTARKDKQNKAEAGARRAARISPEELAQRIKDALVNKAKKDDSERDLEHAFSKDGSLDKDSTDLGFSLCSLLGSDIKVRFDGENFDADTAFDSGAANLGGFQTLGSGLTFFGCAAGGDWEHPVFYIVYWDGKKIRGYVPTDGNPWNTDTKEAYGNDSEKDFQNAVKRYPEKYKRLLDEGFSGTTADLPDVCHDVSFEWDKIRADIEKRIAVS